MWSINIIIHVIEKTKMKPVYVKSYTHINSNKEINDKDLTPKTGDIAKISKYKNIFEKGNISTWCEEGFVTKKDKNTLAWTYVISLLNGEEMVGTFSEKELRKTN